MSDTDLLIQSLCANYVQPQARYLSAPKTEQDLIKYNKPISVPVDYCTALREPLNSLRDFDRLLVKQEGNRFDYFSKYCDDNREHQNLARAAASTATIGQIISPCGTGKTRIQICLHVGGMIELSLKKECGVFVIASHRLALNRQLCDELAGVIIKCGLPIDILTIGSDRSDSKKYYAKYAKEGYTPDTSNQHGTLSAEECQTFIAQSKKLGRHVLVVSTYNSIDRLSNVGTIDLVTHDEAHNTVRLDFTNNILKIKDNILREYFFTATRKVADNNGGMNDASFYGSSKPLIDILPQDMLEKGEIACPRIHSVGGANEETTNTYDTPMLVKNTIEAFQEHKKWIKFDAFSPDDIGAKIIIGCEGIKEMENIYNYPSFRQFALANKVACFAISSKGGGAECYFNYQLNSDRPNKVSREEFFTALNSLSDAEDALIFNVDMLTEGIDLPTITGVMPMRNLGVIKLIQLIGRALRLTKTDRQRLYSNQIVPGDYKQYVKPYGHLILPRHLNSCNEYARMKEIVERIYAEYKSPIEEMVIQDKFNDQDSDDLNSMIRPDLEGGKDYTLHHNIMDVVSSVYETCINKMRSQDRKNHLINMVNQ
jgi:hypothetical protein